MGDARIVAIQTAYWLKATLRTPRVLVFSLFFPVLLLVLFNSIFVRAAKTQPGSRAASG